MGKTELECFFSLWGKKKQDLQRHIEVEDYLKDKCSLFWRVKEDCSGKDYNGEDDRSDDDESGFHHLEQNILWPSRWDK